MSEIFSAINFDAAKYVAGEKPYINVMNRPIEALHLADNQLDSAIQFLAKSCKLQVTDDTEALLHFEGDASDAVGEFEATKVGTDTEIFAYDGFMRGSAFIQPAATNLLSGATDVNPALTSLNGWTLTGVSTQKADVKVDSTGLTITNINGVDIPAGVLEVASDAFHTVPGHLLSFSLELDTPSNLVADAISVEVGLSFSATEGGEVTATRSLTASPVTWHGRLQFEDSTIPADSNFAFAFIKITYAEGSKATLRFKNFMASETKIASIFTLATKSATTLDYPALVDFSGDSVSIVGWTKFSTAFLDTHMSPACPVSLVSADGLVYLEPEHTHDDAGNIVLNLIRSDGAARQTVSNDIVLPGTAKDTYLPFVLRLHRTLDLVEFAVVDPSFTIQKASIALPNPVPAGRWKLRIGRGDART